MPGSNIPDAVRRFLLGAIPSVPHLEAILLLHAEPLQRWTPAVLARRLYIDNDATERLLADLAGAGLVHREADGVRIALDDPHIAEVLGQVVDVYARHVVEVAELIHSSSERKAHNFADAFRLRKEP